MGEVQKKAGALGHRGLSMTTMDGKLERRADEASKKHNSMDYWCSSVADSWQHCNPHELRLIWRQSVRTTLGTGASGSAKDGMAFFGRPGRGPRGGLTKPLYAYKVYVEDGREELVRGCQFGQVTLRSLRDIIAADESQEAYNQIGSTPPSSIIAPSVIFEELDLTKVEIERDKRPFLKAPGAR